MWSGGSPSPPGKWGPLLAVAFCVRRRPRTSPQPFPAPAHQRWCLGSDSLSEPQPHRAELQGPRGSCLGAPQGRGALFPVASLPPGTQWGLLSPTPSLSGWERVTQRGVGTCLRPHRKSPDTWPWPRAIAAKPPMPPEDTRAGSLGQLGDSGAEGASCPPTGHRLQVNPRVQPRRFGGVLDGACWAKSEGLGQPIVPLDGADTHRHTVHWGGRYTHPLEPTLTHPRARRSQQLPSRGLPSL